MLSFAASADNKIGFGDLSTLDAPAAYSIGFDIYQTDLTGTQGVFGKRNSVAENLKGWIVYTSSGTVYSQHGNGINYSGVSATSALTVNTATRVMITWDGTNVKFFYNNTAVGAPAQNQAIVANAAAVTIGSDSDAQANCLIGRVGNVMWWNVALTADEVLAHAAGMIPRAASLKFWAPCYHEPGYDVISQTAGTKTGTVSTAEDLCFATPQYFSLASRLIFPSAIPITQVTSDVLALVEGSVQNIGLNITASNVLALVEAANHSIGLNITASDVLEIQDGDGHNLYDPFGYVDYVETNGVITTTWRRIFPPFIRRTRWS